MRSSRVVLQGASAVWPRPGGVGVCDGREKMPPAHVGYKTCATRLQLSSWWRLTVRCLPHSQLVLLCARDGMHAGSFAARLPVHVGRLDCHRATARPMRGCQFFTALDTLAFERRWPLMWYPTAPLGYEP